MLDGRIAFAERKIGGNWRITAKKPIGAGKFFVNQRRFENLDLSAPYKQMVAEGASSNYNPALTSTLGDLDKRHDKMDESDQTLVMQSAKK